MHFVKGQTTVFSDNLYNKGLSIKIKIKKRKGKKKYAYYKSIYMLEINLGVKDCITSPPVRMARSSKFALLFSPKPGALIAQT